MEDKTDTTTAGIAMFIVETKSIRMARHFDAPMDSHIPLSYRKASAQMLITITITTDIIKVKSTTNVFVRLETDSMLFAAMLYSVAVVFTRRKIFQSKSMDFIFSPVSCTLTGELIYILIGKVAESIPYSWEKESISTYILL